MEKLSVYGGEHVSVRLCYEQILEMRDFTFSHTVFYRPIQPITHKFTAEVHVVEPQVSPIPHSLHTR